MYIYNVTLNVEESICDAWLKWVKLHISKVLGTGNFMSAKLTKVLVEEDMGGETYSVQFLAKSREALDAYYSQNAEVLRDEMAKKFGNNVLAFRTELEVVEDFFITN